MIRLVTAACLLVMISACQTPDSVDQTIPVTLASSISNATLDDDFGDHWYQGKAEITSYKLEQARYGEVHPGQAVMIFVTEDFSKEKQVKLDRPGQAGDDKVGVLKMNTTRQFYTGIYPYTMMTSVFTPIQSDRHPHTLKVTTSSQEWCGHSFTQLNLSQRGYAFEQRSYFESEGDVNVDLPMAMLEDEVWTRLRLDPKSLPTGSVDLIPGTIFQRFKHTAPQVAKAQAELMEGDTESSYTLSYPDLDRTLTISFSTAFPHEILGWEETMASRGKTLTTRATKDQSMMTAYWGQNSLSDSALREQLNLD